MGIRITLSLSVLPLILLGLIGNAFASEGSADADIDIAASTELLIQQDGDDSNDATAVLIAGAQSNALSVLSAFVVIGAIAFGTLYISVNRKRN